MSSLRPDRAAGRPGRRLQRRRARAALLVLVLAGPSAAPAGEAVAAVKVARGQVDLARGAAVLPVAPGTQLETSDEIRTGPDGSVGITFADNSLVSLGPNSRYTIERFDFNSTTHAGQFEAKLARGSLAMISGKLAKHAPDAVRVRTPSIILGVRGTEFLVEVPERSE